MKVSRTETKEFPGLGDRIKKARKLCDRPLSFLATDAGMSAANWYRIEKGEVKTLPIETVRAIEAALGVDLGVDFDS